MMLMAGMLSSTSTVKDVEREVEKRVFTYGREDPLLSF